LDFGIGEMNPEIPLPPFLRDAIVSAYLDGNHGHYSSSQGKSPLKICAVLLQLFNRQEMKAFSARYLMTSNTLA